MRRQEPSISKEFFFFQAEDGIRDVAVTGVQTCALPISSSGWAKKTAHDARELEPEGLADRAARKALDSREPREVPPGKYTVILEAAAVLDMLGFLVIDFGGLAVHEKRSCLTDRVGAKLFGENVN